MLSLKTHNVMDYIIALALVAAPFVFGFADIPTARNLFVVLGLGLAVYSLITKYYYSIAKILPLGFHMVLDCSAGVLAIAAPFIFGYRDQLTDTQMAVHYIMGAGALVLVAVTRTRTESAKNPEELRETTGHHSIGHDRTTSFRV